MKIYYNADGSITVNVEYFGSYRITEDSRWGIRIECIGTTTIPYCADLVERPDIGKQQMADKEFFLKNPRPEAKVGAWKFPENAEVIQ